MYFPPGTGGSGGSGSGSGGRGGSDNKGTRGNPLATRYTAKTRGDYKANSPTSPKAKQGAYGGTQLGGSRNKFRQELESKGKSKAKDSIARLKAAALKTWDENPENSDQQK